MSSDAARLVGSVLAPRILPGADDPYSEFDPALLDRFPPRVVIVRTGTRDQVLEVLDELAERLPAPPLVLADLEGGFRIFDDAPVLPPAMALGAADDEDLAREAGRATALAGAAWGVAGILAPVLDVFSLADAPIVGNRSFGTHPERVAALGAAYVGGVHEGGGLAVIKHFPGHGAAAGDSHLERPLLAADRATWETRDLPPFKAVLGAGARAVMTGHLEAPALGCAEGEPASGSRAVVDGLLRGDWGFDGLVMTDALTMAGATGAASSLEAGNDLALMPSDALAAAESLAAAAGRDPALAARLQQASSRIRRACASVAPRPQLESDLTEALAACDDVAARIAAAAATIVGPDLHEAQPDAVVVSGERVEAYRGSLAPSEEEADRVAGLLDAANDPVLVWCGTPAGALAFSVPAVVVYGDDDASVAAGRAVATGGASAPGSDPTRPGN